MIDRRQQLLGLLGPHRDPLVRLVAADELAQEIRVVLRRWRSKRTRPATHGSTSAARSVSAERPRTSGSAQATLGRRVEPAGPGSTRWS